MDEKYMGDVKEIKLYEKNGYVYPAFVLKDGSEYRAKHQATGNCYFTYWNLTTVTEED